MGAGYLQSQYKTTLTCILKINLWLYNHSFFYFKLQNMAIWILCSKQTEVSKLGNCGKFQMKGTSRTNIKDFLKLYISGGVKEYGDQQRQCFSTSIHLESLSKTNLEERT